MPQNRLQNHSLTSLFDYQISKQELSAQITTAINLFRKGSKKYFSLCFPIQKVDALAVLEQNPEKGAFEYYWEKPSEEFSIAAAGELARIRTTGNARFKDASYSGKQLINEIFYYSKLSHSKTAPHLFGGFSFHDHNVSKDWSEFGAASFTLPEWSVIVDGSLCLLTITFKLNTDDTIQSIVHNIYKRLDYLNELCSSDTYETGSEFLNNQPITLPDTDSKEFFSWKFAIENATGHIDQKRYEKIVLARKLNIKTDNSVSDTHILNRLRHQYPDCYSFLIRQSEKASFIGCTPERLASFNKDYILTEGLAGSTPRGKTASEDVQLENELLKSKKDRNEHEFVINAIFKNLKSYSDSLHIPELPSIKKLTNVQHLYTPIRAHIKEGVSKTEVLKNLHPTPAVGGYPREQAVPYISRFEDFDRGWYAAPVGWINANGDGEFVVAIRSGLIKKDEVNFYAGCGIVKGSDPLKEWEETNLKFIPMLSALEYARK
ncbi:MAG: isochorismate synthase [Balneola sp.]|nr:isochorismate synthase [Balneola sp.]MBO6651328.1 isochorismate synthase [Balneola sp.]MBO6710796.1 isochorismate synthase [Balneola sp.]MBO6799483.1 isochorismate synthase [Balneola sp.]MBO6870215.1 isochorismate synthase [Balneola sp.]